MGRIRVPDPMRDVGLIRWECAFERDEEKEVVDGIQGYVRALLLEEDEESWLKACGRFTVFTERVGRTRNDSTIACGVLWMLDAHQLMVRIINAYKTIWGKRLQPGLESTRRSHYYERAAPRCRRDGQTTRRPLRVRAVLGR